MPDRERATELRPVGFGVVGLGMGRTRARQLKREEEQGLPVRLVAVADIDEERVVSASNQLGVPWTKDFTEWLSLPEIEVVYVVTETGNHARVAVEALKAGKHVLCTKPMEVSLAAAKEMVRVAREKDVCLAIDFDKRHTSATSQRIKRAMDEGRLGRILVGDTSLRTLRTAEYFAAHGGWRGTWALDGGGVLSNQSIHEIDQLMFLLGMPDAVEARIWQQNHDIEAEDLGTAVWHYDDGRVGFVRGTTCWPAGGWYSRHEIHGTEGAVIWSEAPQEGEQWFLDGKWQESPPDYLVNLSSATTRFARAIRLGEPMPVDGEEGLRSLAVLRAMYAAAEQSKPVSPAELLSNTP